MWDLVSVLKCSRYNRKWKSSVYKILCIKSHIAYTLRTCLAVWRFFEIYGNNHAKRFNMASDVAYYVISIHIILSGIISHEHVQGGSRVKNVTTWLEQIWHRKKGNKYIEQLEFSYIFPHEKEIENIATLYLFNKFVMRLLRREPTLCSPTFSQNKNIAFAY